MIVYSWFFMYIMFTAAQDKNKNIKLHTANKETTQYLTIRPKNKLKPTSQTLYSKLTESTSIVTSSVIRRNFTLNTNKNRSLKQNRKDKKDSVTNTSESQQNSSIVRRLYVPMIKHSITVVATISDSATQLPFTWTGTEPKKTSTQYKKGIRTWKVVKFLITTTKKQIARSNKKPAKPKKTAGPFKRTTRTYKRIRRPRKRIMNPKKNGRNSKTTKRRLKIRRRKAAMLETILNEASRLSSIYVSPGEKKSTPTDFKVVNSSKNQNNTKKTISLVELRTSSRQLNI